MTDNLDKATPLIDKILPVADGSLAWYFAFAALTFIVVVAITKYFEYKVQKEKILDNKPKQQNHHHSKREYDPESFSMCSQHSKTIHEIQTQLENLGHDTRDSMQSLKEELNMSELDNERQYSKLFKEMMIEIQAQMDRRDDKIERMIDSKLTNFKEGLMLSISATFRPMVESVVSEIHVKREPSSRG